MIMWIDCGKRVENCMILSLEAPSSMCWCVEAGARDNFDHSEVFRNVGFITVYLLV
jgi:hypothetical protein